MFSKPAKSPSSAPRPEHGDSASSHRKPVIASLIAESVTIEGDLASDGDVHLDGAVKGDLRVSHLTIGENGRVEGAIRADTVEVRGVVMGSITARQVRLCATARVTGDVTHSELAVEAGAEFEGRSVKFHPPAVETLSVVAAE
ncbi:MAG: polymer-forming cytoskeletal protein [Phenylobacterium sp.]